MKENLSTNNMIGVLVSEHQAGVFAFKIANRHRSELGLCRRLAVAGSNTGCGVAELSLAAILLL